MNISVASPDFQKLDVVREKTIPLKDLLAGHPDVSPFADGWYVIEFAKKIRTDKLISKKFLGEDVVIYRNPATAEVVVVQGHCPHMGAHFDSYQNGGCVKDGVITCPYHALKFDSQGKCVDGKAGVSRATLKKYPTMEHNGFVLAYYQQHGTGTPPRLNLDLPETDPSEFAFITQTLGTFNGDPMVPLMANADMNHFFSVHGTKRLRPTKPFTVSEDGLIGHFGFEADMHSDVDNDYPRGGAFRLMRKYMTRAKIKDGPGRNPPPNTTVDSYGVGPSLMMSRWVQPYMKVEGLTWVYTTPITPYEYEVFMVQGIKTLKKIRPQFLQKLVNWLLVRNYAWLMDMFVGHEDPPFYNNLKLRLAKPVYIKNDVHLVKYQTWWKSLASPEFQALTADKNIHFS